ncbi:MAG: arylsulfatase [Pseudomonadota bacterium]
MKQCIKWIALGLSLFVSASACTVATSLADTAHPEQKPASPNIVIIYADDLGYGDVSIYNSDSKIPTQHIDALAKEGVWLTDGHSPSTVCTPSRYALLTGRYAWRTPLRSGVLMPWGAPVIEEGRTTLAEYLRAQGYETALIGKWHLGLDWPWADGMRPDDSDILEQGWISIATTDQFDWSKPIKRGPTDEGFDYYLGDDIPNMPPYAWIENDRIEAERLIDVPRSALISVGFTAGIHGSGPGEPGWQLDQVMPRLVKSSVDYITERSDSDQPFFLMLSLTSPHTPIVPTEEFDGTSDAGTYGDFVVQTDDAVGKVVDALKSTGQFENTLIVVTSDNGPEFTAYRQLKRFDHDSVAGLRGIKSDTWEGGHRVPFILSWPNGGIGGGQAVDALISQMDLFATVADIRQSPAGETTAPDSQSVLSALTLETETAREDLVYHGSRGTLGLRQGDWVYLRGGGFGRSPLPLWSEPEWIRERRGVVVDGSTEDALYDLASDPTQLTNVIAQHPDRAAQMAARLAEIEAE